jgi:hypothetical protein
VVVTAVLSKTMVAPEVLVAVVVMMFNQAVRELQDKVMLAEIAQGVGFPLVVVEVVLEQLD